MILNCHLLSHLLCLLLLSSEEAQMVLGSVHYWYLILLPNPSKDLFSGQNVVPDHICLSGLQNKYPASLMHQDINNNVNSAHFMQIVLIHAKMK